MRVEHATWPFSVMKGRWEISKVKEECQDATLTNIISKKTGHIVVQVGCDATSEKLRLIQREIAEHIVELHNSQLKK